MSIFKQYGVRIDGLTDAVFAIVMTLLVLELGIPLFTGTSTFQDFNQLLEMWPILLSYVVTFLMLGYIWAIHHTVYGIMNRTDSLFILINIFCMMFSALLPFSMSLLIDNMGRQLPVLVYEGNFFMITLIAYINLWYVTGKRRLVDADIDLSEMMRRKKMVLIGMVFIVTIMGLSFINTMVSMCFFIGWAITTITINTLRNRVRTIGQAKANA